MAAPSISPMQMSALLRNPPFVLEVVNRLLWVAQSHSPNPAAACD
jgi:hypothetical protein